MGYWRAGFEVIGFDIRPQPRYPFQFYQTDALGLVKDWSWLEQADAAHLSPPCQAFTKLRTLGGVSSNPDMDLLEVLPAMEGWHKPYAIENVEYAPMGKPTYHLCGSMFPALVARNGTRQLRRHRQFKVNFEIPRLACQHNGLKTIGVYGDLGFVGPPPSYIEYPRDLGEANRLMGINWMKWWELKEAIPPAYTRWVGTHMLASMSSPG